MLDPINKMYVKPYEVSKANKEKKLQSARETILKLKPELFKTIQEIHKIEPYILAGTFEETILLKMEQMQHLIINQLEA